VKKYGLIIALVIILIIIGACSYFAGAHLKSKAVKATPTPIVQPKSITVTPETTSPTVTEAPTEAPTPTGTPTLTPVPTLNIKVQAPIFKLIATSTPTPTPKLLQINKNIIQLQK